MLTSRMVRTRMCVDIVVSRTAFRADVPIMSKSAVGRSFSFRQCKGTEKKYPNPEKLRVGNEIGKMGTILGKPSLAAYNPAINRVGRICCKDMDFDSNHQIEMHFFMNNFSAILARNKEAPQSETLGG